ncbi:VapC Predicted nucleic acid-binding protein, contains PIN domain [Spirosomataceae bacterium]|jgi:predicted nucleic acid-binding protein
MILVDSSVWIDYFKGSERTKTLDLFIELDLVATNELILTELLPFLRLRNEKGIFSILSILPRIELEIFWEGIREIQKLNLKRGVNNVGIPDLIIAQQCVDKNLELWTFDKHFKLMSEYLELKIYS